MIVLKILTLGISSTPSANSRHTDTLGARIDGTIGETLITVLPPLLQSGGDWGILTNVYRWKDRT